MQAYKLSFLKLYYTHVNGERRSRDKTWHLTLLRRSGLFSKRVKLNQGYEPIRNIAASIG